MKILICNLIMSARSGTETVTAEFALGLKERGHTVEIFTNKIGPICDELEIAGIRTYTDITLLSRPEVIHINHLVLGQRLIERFPSVPAIFHCHDSSNLNSQAQASTSIIAWFGISYACQNRVAKDLGISPSSVGLLPNYVNICQSPLIVRTLPQKPRKWLFAAEKQKSRKVFYRLWLLSLWHRAKLTQVGPHAAYTVEDFGLECTKYDLVFASARCALEASAAGAGVVVCDSRGLSGFLGIDQWRLWGMHNLGLGSFRSLPTLTALHKAINSWDADQAMNVASSIRSERDLRLGIDQLQRIYHQVMASQ